MVVSRCFRLTEAALARSLFVIFLCLVQLSAVASAAYAGNLMPPDIFLAVDVKNFSSQVGCNTIDRAVGAPDWNTACDLSEDVSDCRTDGAMCDIFYLCNGWAPAYTDTAPFIELMLPTNLAEISQIAIYEKGSRGWLEQITLIAADNAESVVYVSSLPHNTPSELHKMSPDQRPGGPYYAPGLDYRGGVNVTSSGLPCVNWLSSPLAPSLYNGLGNHSFCRNPTNSHTGPWCFTAPNGANPQTCSVELSDICDDGPLLVNFNPVVARVWNTVRLSFRNPFGTFLAIDALQVSGSEAVGCWASVVKGYWVEPHCDNCNFPYKGATCSDLTCGGPGGTPCLQGFCTNLTCTCVPGFWGPDCAIMCPTTGDPGAVLEHFSAFNFSQVCAGNGVCMDGTAGNGTCVCQPGFAGSTCSIACPRNPVTGFVCSANGTCADGALGSGTCTCKFQRYGAACERTLCGGLQCLHGTCRSDRCYCDFGSDTGYWSGQGCDQCASGYAGWNCEQSDLTHKTIEDRWTWNAQPMPGVEGHDLVVLLGQANSNADISLYGEGDFFFDVVGSASCRGDVNANSPYISCTLTPTDFSQRLRLTVQAPQGRSFDRTVENYVSIAVGYKPSCLRDCGDHGYCTDPLPSGAPAPVSTHLSTSGRSVEVASRGGGGIVRRRLRNLLGRQLLSAPPTVFIQGALRRAYSSVQLDISYTSFPSATCFYLTHQTDNLLALGYSTPGDICHRVVMNSQSVRTVDFSSAGPLLNFFLDGLTPATNYHLYWEAQNDLGNAWTLSGPVLFTTLPPPTVRVWLVSPYTSTVTITWSLNRTIGGTADLCAVPAGGFVDWTTSCNATTGAVAASVTTGPGTARQSTQLAGLAPLTNYDFYYRGTTTGSPAASGSPVYQGTFATLNAPELLYGSFSYDSTDQVRYCYYPSASGTVFGALSSASSAVVANSLLPTATASGAILAVYSHAVTSWVSDCITMTGLALGQTYHLDTATTDTSNNLSPAGGNPPLYFTAAGLKPRLYDFQFPATQPGTSLKFRFASATSAMLFVVVRFGGNAAPTAASMLNSFDAQPAVSWQSQPVALTGNQPVVVDVTVNGVYPTTTYDVYVLATDGMQQKFSNITNFTLTSSMQGVIPCGGAITAPDQICALYSENVGGHCSCIQGFQCYTKTPPAMCIDSATYQLAISRKGVCLCDNNTALGYWNKTTQCTTCVTPYFGDYCSYKCVRGSYDPSFGGCACPNQFTGETCDECPSYYGYYGPHCDTQSPAVILADSVNLDLGSTYQYGMYRALMYSGLVVIVQMAHGQALRNFDTFQFTFYKAYTDLNSQTQSAASQCNNQPQQQGSTPVVAEKGLVLDCTLQDDWTRSANTFSCSANVPEGYNFWVFQATGKVDLPGLTFYYQVVPGCCNGHGLCRNYTDVCECISNSQLGYWDPSVQCASCQPGYAGGQCTDVSVRRESWTSGATAVQFGNDRWYALRIEPNMPVDVVMDATGDCDIQVELTNVCRSGWTEYNGKCYRLFAETDDCTDHVNATDFCNSQGGRMVTMRSSDDWAFYKRMWLAAGMSSPRLTGTKCNRAHISMVRTKATCTVGAISQNDCFNMRPLCTWQPGPFPGRCVNDVAACFGSPNRNACLYPGGNPAAGRKACVWRQLGPGAAPANMQSGTCLPGFEFEDSPLSRNFVNNFIGLEANAVMGLEVPCTSYPTQLLCAGAGNPGPCQWITPPLPAVPYCGANNQFDYTGGNDQLAQTPPLMNWDTMLVCGMLIAPIAPSETATPDVRLIEALCSDSVVQSIPPETHLMYPNAAPFCEIPYEGDAQTISQVSPSGVIGVTSAMKSMLTNPDCKVEDTTYSGTCNLFSTATDNLAIARIRCLDDATFSVNFSFVRRRHTAGHVPSSSTCANNAVDGSWAGSICTDCAPRYSGRDCTHFERCGSDAECGGHGTCALVGGNGTRGYCTCAAGYYGIYCDTYCNSATTCNGGACNSNYQVCPGTWGTPRGCSANNNLCICTPPMQGSFCDECAFGTFGVGCVSSCSCNSQGCNAVTGACKCFGDSTRGYWNASTGCSSCKQPYYGVSCTVRCLKETTCSGHGTCQDDGSCSCLPEWYTSGCSARCTTALCGGRGTCSTAGKCNCPQDFTKGFWATPSCTTCSVGYWGPLCTLECQCSARGPCARLTGVCQCYDDDVNGHFAGTNCRSCATGYSGATCTVTGDSSRNELGYSTAYQVGTNARLAKGNEWAGAIVSFNDSATTAYYYLAVAAQITLFRRPIDGSAPWSYVGFCNLGAIGLADGVIVAVQWYNHVAYFLVRATTDSYLLPASTTSLIITAGACNLKKTDVITLSDPTLYVTDNVTLADVVTYYTQAYDMVFDPNSIYLYVMYRRYTDLFNDDAYKISRINLRTLATAKRGFHDIHTMLTMDLLEFVNVTAIAFYQDVTKPMLFASGIDRIGAVRVSQYFVPTRQRPTLRAGYSFVPGACSFVNCVRAVKMAYLRDLLYIAMQTSSTYTSDITVIWVNVSTTERIKSVASNYVYSTVKYNATGCGFLLYDPFVDAIYVAAGNSTPSVILKLHALTFAPFSSSLTLSYGQSTSEVQVAVAATISPEKREIMILNRLTRVTFMVITLVEVQRIVPNIVDGNGGTNVTVFGNGFKDLGTKITCRWGDQVNEQIGAQFINSTVIICRAPGKVSFDSCQDLPLEVNFGSGIFTANNVMVRYTNTPNVQSIQPSNRVGLTALLSSPLTIIGNGFILTNYLLCVIDNQYVAATFVTSTKMLCPQPNRTNPVQTTVEVSLDGQKFSFNKVDLYLVGPPLTMTAVWQGNTDPVYTVQAAARVNLTSLTVTFFDGAGTELKNRDEALRGHNVTLTLTSSLVAPKDVLCVHGYCSLHGNLTLPIVPKTGAVSFGNLYLLYPARGDYTLRITTSYNATFTLATQFTVVSVASKLRLDTTLSHYSSNKTLLSTVPIQVSFADEAENIAITETTRVALTLVNEDYTDANPIYLQGVSGDGVTFSQGVNTYSKLQVVAPPGWRYRLRWLVPDTSKHIAPLYADLMYVTSCPAGDIRVAELIPSAGRLGPQNVTVKGYPLAQSNIRCKFGADAPTTAIPVDICTVICQLPPRSAPFSAPLELSTSDNSEFTSLGLNYSYLGTTAQLTADIDGDVSSYPSDYFVTLNDITLTFRDSFGSWIREFDSTVREIYLLTDLPITSDTILPVLWANNSLAVFSGLTTPLPLKRQYLLYFTTQPVTTLPAYGTQAAQAANASTAAPATLAPSTAHRDVTKTIPMCPQPVSCRTVGSGYFQCLFERDPRNPYSFTPTKSLPFLLPHTAPPPTIINATTPAPTLPNATVVPSTPVPTTTPPVTLPPVGSTFFLSAQLVVSVTQGTPASMVFAGATATFAGFSLFVTNKDVIDEQPILNVLDAAGNLITIFSALPAAQATVAPTPLCLESLDSDGNCPRYLGGDLVSGAVEGALVFKQLEFLGQLGTTYRLHFKVTIPGVPELISPAMHVANCPESRDLLTSISPNWVSDASGGTITVKGYGFKRLKPLALTIGSQTFTTRYVDTCTLLCDIPAANARRQASSTLGPQKVTLQGAASSLALQVKSDLATRLGFSKTRQPTAKAEIAAGTYYDPIEKYSLVNVTLSFEACGLSSATDTTAIDCYIAAPSVHLWPIHVVLQDAYSGDLYNGNGWKDGINDDVNFTIAKVSSPGDDRSLTDMIVGPLSGRTIKGICSLNGLQFIKPKSAIEYRLQLIAGNLTKGEYVIKFFQGRPVNMWIYDQAKGGVLTSSPRIGRPYIYKTSNSDMQLVVQVVDAVGNLIDIDRMKKQEPGRSSLTLVATLIQSAVIRPPPLTNLSMGTIVQKYSADLTMEGFSFARSTIQLLYGYEFMLSFDFDSSGIDYRTAYNLPVLQVTVVQEMCAAGLYGRNNTAQCLPVPVGGFVQPTNHSMWLYTSPNYWRYQTMDDVFYECKANCIGGYYSDCLQGTTGPTCAVCDPGWGKQGDSCLQCPSMAISVLTIFGLALAVLFVIVVMVQSNLSTEVKPKSVFSIVIKILMNHLQTATLMQSFMTKVKGIVKQILDAESKASPDTNIASFACVTGWSQYGIFLMWMIVPAVVLMIPGVIAVVVRIIQQRRHHRKKRRITREISRRHAMGLQTLHQELHLAAIETGEMPDVSHLQRDDNDGDDNDGNSEGDGGSTERDGSDEVTPPLSEVDNADLEDVLQSEVRGEDQRRAMALEQRRQAVEARVRAVAEDEMLKAMQTLQDPHSTEEAKAEAERVINTNRAAASAVGVADSERRALPTGWTEHASRSTGLSYWYHRETGERTWVRPACVAKETVAAAITGAELAVKETGGPATAAAKEVSFSGFPVAAADAIANDENDDGGMVLHPPEPLQLQRLPSRSGGKALVGGLSRCAVCCVDFALYECAECAGLRPGSAMNLHRRTSVVDGSRLPYCESCWNVIHAANGTKHFHRQHRCEIQEAAEWDESVGKKFQALYEDVKRRQKEIPAVEVWIVTVLVVIFIVYPRLMTQIATMMKCVTIESLGRSFLEADMTIDCGTTQYAQWRLIATGFFLCYGIGIPLAGSILLFSKRKTLLQKKTLCTYGFLYSGYRMKRFYWEFVIMVRKMAVVFIIVFYSGDQSYQVMFGMWLLAVFLLLNIFAQPFQLRLYWYLENVSLASVVITLNAAMLYQPHFSMGPAADTTVTVFIFLVNLAVLVVFAYFIFYAAKVQFLQVFDADGSGDVTWKEMIVVVRRRLFERYGRQLRSWGFSDADLRSPAAAVEPELDPAIASKYNGEENPISGAASPADDGLTGGLATSQIVVSGGSGALPSPGRHPSAPIDGNEFLPAAPANCGQQQQAAPPA